MHLRSLRAGTGSYLLCRGSALYSLHFLLGFGGRATVWPGIWKCEQWSNAEGKKWVEREEKLPTVKAVAYGHLLLNSSIKIIKTCKMLTISGFLCGNCCRVELCVRLAACTVPKPQTQRNLKTLNYLIGGQTLGRTVDFQRLMHWKAA